MSDTATEAQALYDDQLKALTHAERYRRALDLSAYARQLAWAGAEQAADSWDVPRYCSGFFFKCMGRMYRCRRRSWRPAISRMASSPSDLGNVIDDVVTVLRELEIPHFVTGSLASSMHGEFRATNDIDIVVDLSKPQLREFLRLLTPRFIADVKVAELAYFGGTSFHLIHTGVYLKVDVFPASGAFEKQAISRAVTVVLPGAEQPLSIATREDILLAKLRWFRAGGESSAVQWRDIQRLWSLNSAVMDIAHMQRWADALRRQRPVGSGHEGVAMRLSNEYGWSHKIDR